MIWKGALVIVSTVMIIVLHKLHVWLNVTKSRIAQIVQWVLVAIIILQIFRYLIESLTQSGSLVNFYPMSVLMVHIGLITYMLYLLLRKVLHDDL